MFSVEGLPRQFCEVFKFSRIGVSRMSLPLRGGPDRLRKITAENRAKIGTAEAMIKRLVRTFYVRVREDQFLGPAFAARIKDWEPHLQRMCALWSSVVLTTGVYHSQPMQIHLPLPIAARHFDRWLELIAATSRDLYRPRSLRSLSNAQGASRKPRARTCRLARRAAPQG